MDTGSAGGGGEREEVPGDLELGPVEARLVRLMEEFRRRERRCPELVVRPWWSTGVARDASPRVGFVLEYCPGGRDSVELVVRGDRVTVEGPAEALEARLDLGAGWVLDGRETGSPETLANYLLRLADGALGEGEAA